MIGTDLSETRFCDFAMVNGDRAARMEATAFGRVDRAGDIALQDDAFPFDGWIGDRDS